MKITGISFIQILKYFKFKKTELSTSFYNHYSNNHFEFILFVNSNNDNSYSLFDVYNQTIISKENFIKQLSITFSDNCLKKIKEIEDESFNLEQSTEDEIIKAFYNIESLSNNNIVLEQYNISQMLFTKQFKNILQNNDESIILPFFKNDKIINYNIITKDGENRRFNINNGYYITENIKEECNIIIIFSFSEMLQFFQNNIYSEYITIIPNTYNISLTNVNDILNHITKLVKENEGMTNNFEILYDSNKLESLVATLKFKSLICCIKSEYIIRVLYDRKISIEIIPPATINRLKFIEKISNLNEIMYEKLGIKKENRINWQEYLFQTNSLKGKNNYYINFFPKLELIEIIFQLFDDFIEDKNFSQLDINTVCREIEDFQSIE